MRIATILIVIPLFSVAAGTGRVERCNFDLRAPSRQIALHATEGLDTAVEASIRADGTIPDLSGWRLLLWYGDAATNPPLGVAFTNISLSRGVARWDIPGSQIATNGRFAVQIVGQHTSGRSEEWARGWLAIDANSASSFAALTFGTPGWALTTNVQAMIAAEAQARASGDVVAMTNWQARVNALTNGAALGSSALQPPATNTLAAAAAHAATAHGVTVNGGFQGGTAAFVVINGAAIGSYATSQSGGAVGYSANAKNGGAVGGYAITSDGFAGGVNAFATDDGTASGNGIDAIQLGTGGNSEPFSLQIYGHKLMHADGTIPVERFAATLNASNGAHNVSGTAHADIRALIPTLPGPGCTELTYDANGTTVTITGATYSYFFAPDKAYTLSVAPDAPRYHYSIEIIGDHACTLPAGHRLRGSWTITGTNEVVVAPSTGTVWNVFGRGL